MTQNKNGKKGVGLKRVQDVKKQRRALGDMEKRKYRELQAASNNKEMAEQYENHRQVLYI